MSSRRLFSYPGERHVRRLSPGPFRSYRQYKPALRSEFEATCVYCRMPDRLNAEVGFGVDHYRPSSKFPALTTVYANLYYACNACNSRKRDFWPTRVDLLAKRFVPNPCDHMMRGHLRYLGTKVEAHSSAGTWTVLLLQLNHERAIEHRNRYQDVVDLAHKVVTTCGERIRMWNLKIPRASVAERLRLEGAVAKEQAELDKANKLLADLLPA